MGLLYDREEWRDASGEVRAELEERLEGDRGDAALSDVIVPAKVEDARLPGPDDLLGLAERVRERLELEAAQLRTLSHHLARMAHSGKPAVNDAKGAPHGIHRRHLPPVP